MSWPLYDGNFTAPSASGPQLVKSINDGTNSLEVRQKYVVAAANLLVYPMNTAGPTVNGRATYLVEQGTAQPIGAGLVEFEAVYCALPANRVEFQQQVRPVTFVTRQYQGNIMIDAQIGSASVSTWVQVNFYYHLGPYEVDAGIDGPWTSVLHFIPPFLPQVVGNAPNGTYGGHFFMHWQRRRWRGDIWEQSTFFN